MDHRRIVRQRSFPQISLPSADGGRGIEVALIAQLDPGAGDALATRAGERQQHHRAHHDALDEPSALLSAADVGNQDPASLHSFAVGHRGHPFHRHAGTRVFTAISGSGGARLCFSTATSAQLSQNPDSFVHALRQVDVPADCLFTVRMGRNVWHQFLPLQTDGRHPALFALSCHPDEAAGDLSADLREQVRQGDASITDLTELPPPSVQLLLRSLDEHEHGVATTVLGFGADPGAHCARLWTRLRRCIGRLRQRMIGHRPIVGFISHPLPDWHIRSSTPLPADSLLHGQMNDLHHHQDRVELLLPAQTFGNTTADALLAQLLQAFIEQPSTAISGLMRLRNRLVKPWGLRTSPLGCPVSSLLAEAPAQRFAQRFPVLAQQRDAGQTQVLLGADDRHLQFRSCIGICRQGEQLQISLATRVRCRNRFGHLYMALVDPLHRHYIAPTMLGTAVTHLVQQHAQASPQHDVGLPQTG